jgi:hypothetical protein
MALSVEQELHNLEVTRAVAAQQTKPSDKWLGIRELSR